MNLKDENMEYQKDRAEIMVDVKPFAVQLYDGKDGFRDSVARGIDNNICPSPKAIKICADIIAKRTTKPNTPEYIERYHIVAGVFFQAFNQLKDL